MYQDITTVRCIIVPERRKDALIPIIKSCVELGTTMVSDEWSGYNLLAEEGYFHEGVCHKRNYVNPTTVFYTQAI